MAVMRLYQHGVTCGIPGNNGGMAGKRGTVQGWTHAATKNCMAFLRSVTVDQLTGDGFAITLTLRHCPLTPQDWHSLRRAFLKRMERSGLLRSHWVTEWQRRGVPHLHGILYLPESTKPHDWMLMHQHIVKSWLDLAAPFGAERHCQHVNAVTDSLGWFQYLSKHSSRGVLHYQRCKENVPELWKQHTGRVWGYTGGWPIREPISIQMDRRAFFAYRRVIKGWRLADSRSELDPEVRARRITSARRMLQVKRDYSELMGVNEWASESMTLRVVHHLAAAGHKVEC